jgi:protein transport protein SEC61 subunit gamma-like protein
MAFLDRARDFQGEIDGRLRNVGHGKYGRILRMARKPSTDEYVKVLSVTFLGAVLIGTVGFLIYIFFQEYGPQIWSTLFGSILI